MPFHSPGIMVINPAPPPTTFPMKLRTSCLIKFATGTSGHEFRIGLDHIPQFHSPFEVSDNMWIGDWNVGWWSACLYGSLLHGDDVDPGLVALGGDVVACGLG